MCARQPTGRRHDAGLGGRRVDQRVLIVRPERSPDPHRHVAPVDHRVSACGIAQHAEGQVLVSRKVGGRLQHAAGRHIARCRAQAAAEGTRASPEQTRIAERTEAFGIAI
jgi:hypothetical protein